jgi:hypothetical protein
MAHKLLSPNNCSVFSFNYCFTFFFFFFLLYLCSKFLGCEELFLVLLHETHISQTHSVAIGDVFQGCRSVCIAICVPTFIRMYVNRAVYKSKVSHNTVCRDVSCIKKINLTPASMIIIKVKSIVGRHCK